MFPKDFSQVSNNQFTWIKTWKKNPWELHTNTFMVLLYLRTIYLRTFLGPTIKEILYPNWRVIVIFLPLCFHEILNGMYVGSTYFGCINYYVVGSLTFDSMTLKSYFSHFFAFSIFLQWLTLRRVPVWRIRNSSCACLFSGKWAWGWRPFWCRRDLDNRWTLRVKISC